MQYILKSTRTEIKSILMAWLNFILEQANVFWSFYNFWNSHSNFRQNLKIKLCLLSVAINQLITNWFHLWNKLLHVMHWTYTPYLLINISVWLSPWLFWGLCEMFSMTKGVTNSIDRGRHIGEVAHLNGMLTWFMHLLIILSLTVQNVCSVTGQQTDRWHTAPCASHIPITQQTLLDLNLVMRMIKGLIIQGPNDFGN